MIKRDSFCYILWTDATNLSFWQQKTPDVSLAMYLCIGANNSYIGQMYCYSVTSSCKFKRFLILHIIINLFQPKYNEGYT